jgi:hypothetical protein
MRKSIQEWRAIRDQQLAKLKAELVGMNLAHLEEYLAGWLASLCTTLSEDDERLSRLENAAGMGSITVSDATDELPLC